MTEQAPSFERLSAYVDGELDPTDAAVVARWVAIDNSVARTVAVLQELRAGVSEIPPDVMLLATTVEPRAPRRFAVFGLRGALVAACLVIAVTGAGWLSVAGMQESGEADQGAIAELVALHDSWASARTVNLFPASAPTVPAAELLAASGLTQVYAVEVSAPDSVGALRHTAYIGHRGCRLSLFEIPRGSGDKPGSDRLDIIADGFLLTARWENAASRFVMIARNMDAARFATIATAMKSVGERLDGGDAGLVAGLQMARQPCLA